MAVILKYKKDLNKITSPAPILFFYLRFVDNILILYKNHSVTISKIIGVLKNKLKLKGLKMKDEDNYSFWSKPGVSFDYLGFRFLYTNSMSKKLTKRKGTANKYTYPYNTI